MNQKILLVLSCLLLGALSPALSFAATEPSAAPAPTVTGPLATNYFDLQVNYTKPDDAEGVLVVARQASTPTKAPNDNTVYTANARLGVGDTLVPGCILYCDYVVADAAASGTVTVTGLKAGTKYYFAAFSYNGAGTDINYNPTIAPVSATTATVPPEGRSHNEQYVATGPGGSETDSDCTKCHGVHHTSQLLPSGLDQLDKCQSCHRAGGLASAKTDIGLHPADGSVDCGTCHSMHSFRKEELFSTNHAGGKGFNKSFVRANMSKYMNPAAYPPPAGGGAITALDNTVLQDRTTDFAFASDDPARPGIFNGVCQSCHLATDVNHYTQTGADGHQAGEDCIVCHKHSDGFIHGGGSTGCVECHGHDAGTLYDPDMSAPYSAGSEASLGRGTVQSHSTHTETDNDDGKGPGLYCDSCHDITNFPNFKSGTDSNGDGLYSLSETDLCNTCHSPGGTYDGINDPVTGAKAIWRTGSYAATNDSTLQTGKEKWCATCHDEEPSVIKGVAAPNVIGDEDGIYAYGTGWGYYKTGHGLAAGVYTASEAPAAKQPCSGCHDFSVSHIDGAHRTYLAASDNYQTGYRLKYNMDIPRTDVGEPVSDFALCFSCHNSDPYLNSANLTTNFREGVTTNSHYLHLQSPATGPFAGSGRWDSDWDGATGDSKISCPACHNVHGSPLPRMMRHGELISTPGTTDKVPALNFKYTPAGSYPTLITSSGGVLNPPSPGGGTIGNTGVCSMCHTNQEGYTRIPNDMYPPEITSVYGKIGGNLLMVIFSEGVYTTTGASGALFAGDFTYTDADDGRTITGVTHTAGANFAILTLSAALDAVDDIVVDTVAAATATSIYDAASQAMDSTPVAVTGDATAPSLADLSPANSATELAIDSNLTFTLSDSEAGVDWSSFQIQLSGDKGYAKTYTDLDTAVVAKTGSMTSYSVSVNPDANFSTAEVITVTVQVSDHVGNVLTPPGWSFTTQATSTPQTMTIHPSGLAAEGSGNFAPTGGTWADVLDSDDSDLTYVSVCCQGFGTFYVDMDDPAIGGATINSVTVKVVVRNSVANNVDIGYKTGTATIWKGNTSVGTTYTTLTLAASTDSDGGTWSLTDLNNLKVAVLRNYTGSPRCYVTEVAVEINYTP